MKSQHNLYVSQVVPTIQSELLVGISSSSGFLAGAIKPFYQLEYNLILSQCPFLETIRLPLFCQDHMAALLWPYCSQRSIWIIFQSVSMCSPSGLSLRACSRTALRNASMPVPASSGSPSCLTRPPNMPVRKARSKLATAVRNCCEDTIRESTSGEVFAGRSGGRCGHMLWMSSG
jgi:hypothetical protein